MNSFIRKTCIKPNLFEVTKLLHNDFYYFIQRKAKSEIEKPYKKNKIKGDKK